jgi:hypothetical protein
MIRIRSTLSASGKISSTGTLKNCAVLLFCNEHTKKSFARKERPQPWAGDHQFRQVVLRPEITNTVVEWRTRMGRRAEKALAADFILFSE